MILRVRCTGQLREDTARRLYFYLYCVFCEPALSSGSHVPPCCGGMTEDTLASRCQYRTKNERGRGRGRGQGRGITSDAEKEKGRKTSHDSNRSVTGVLCPLPNRHEKAPYLTIRMPAPDGQDLEDMEG